jgi:hypothetical protein
LLDQIAIRWEDAAQRFVQNEWARNELIEVDSIPILL